MRAGMYAIASPNAAQIAKLASDLRAYGAYEAEMMQATRDDWDDESRHSRRLDADMKLEPADGGPVNVPLNLGRQSSS